MNRSKQRRQHNGQIQQLYGTMQPSDAHHQRTPQLKRDTKHSGVTVFRSNGEEYDHDYSEIGAENISYMDTSNLVQQQNQSMARSAFDFIPRLSLSNHTSRKQNLHKVNGNGIPTVTIEQARDSGQTTRRKHTIDQTTQEKFDTIKKEKTARDNAAK